MAAAGPKPPESGRIDGEAAIDEALEETFPASDSPSWTLGVERGSAFRRSEAADPVGAEDGSEPDT
jgi:hypothetical protein